MSDPNFIVQLAQTFVATTDAKTMEEASKLLNDSLCKTQGFGPTCLRLMIDQNVDPVAKHACAIYIKNFIVKHWASLDTKKVLLLNEEDKQVTREIIVDAVCYAPVKLQKTLAQAFARILSWDFPKSWNGSVDKIIAYMSNENPNVVHGSLLCFIEIVYKFNIKTLEEAKPFHDSIPAVFNILLQIIEKYIQTEDQLYLTIVCRCLKIYYKTIEFSLPVQVKNDTNFDKWFKIFSHLLSSPIPAKFQATEEEDRSNVVWKYKRHAAAILGKMLSRYGIPKLAIEDDKPFAEVFMTKYAPTVVILATNLLTTVKDGNYIAPRLQFRLIDILDSGVNHSTTYKVFKSNIMDLLQALMLIIRHSDEDEELWQDDPHEFTRVKYDSLSEYESVAMCSCTFIYNLASKRAKTLEAILQYCVQVLHSVTTQSTTVDQAKSKDGILTIVGTLANRINTKQEYKGSLEKILIEYVLPEFNSKFGFLRARSCWIVDRFSSTNFTNSDLIKRMATEVIGRLGDNELPVRVMAASSLQGVMAYEEAQEIVKPLLPQVMETLINLLNDTANDELNETVITLLTTYKEELTGVIVQLTGALSNTCAKMLDYDEEAADGMNKATCAYGCIKSIQTILAIFKDNKDIVPHIEEAFFPLLNSIFVHEHIDFLDEALELIQDSICYSGVVNKAWWPFFPMMYKLFDTVAFDYFELMVEVLECYVIYDCDTFLSNPDYLRAIYEMCKKNLQDEDAGEIAHASACKMIEIIILKCKGKIDQFIDPFVQLMLARLHLEFVNPSVRILCLEVLAECMYYNPILLLQTLETHKATGAFLSTLFEHLPKFTRVHDIRIVTLALCTLLQVPTNQLPGSIQQGINHVTPAIIGCLRRFPDAVTKREKILAQELDINDLDSNGNFSSDFTVGEELGDEDDLSDNEDAYMKHILAKHESLYGDEDDEDNLQEHEIEEMPTDVIDPFVYFVDTFEGKYGGNDKEAYQHLLNNLSHDDKIAVKGIIDLANKAKQASQ